jgi:hypothetical protein
MLVGDGKIHGENEPRRLSWFVFLTYCTGVALKLSPLVFIRPQFLPSSEYEPPTSLWKGRGGWGRVLASEAASAGSLSPHPSVEGRGSWPGGWRRLGANCGGEGEGGWWQG